MTGRHRSQLVDAVVALVPSGPATYRWCGRERRVVAPAAEHTIGTDELRSFLVDRIGSELYRSFYLSGSPRSDDNLPKRASHVDPMAFVEHLSQANAGRGAWTSGWEVLGDEDGLVILRRSDLKVWAAPQEVLAEAWPITVGTTIQVLMPKELRALSPGFYMAVGDIDVESGTGADPLTRLYFNLATAGAASFIAAVTALLNEAGLAFRAKVVNDPDGFDRCDAGVLYVRRGDLGQLRPILDRVRRAVACHLSAASPAFTFELAAGISAADDPGLTDESFGSNRCAVVAEGLVRAYEKGLEAADARVDAVEACLVEHGIRPEAPYLGDGLDDPYAALKLVA